MGTTATCAAVAQALFVATYTGLDSRSELFPSREFLRNDLRESGAYDWLERQDIELPAWLEQPSD